MRHEVLPSSRHRSRIMLSEGETFNTNAVECGEALCPARPTMCLATSLTFSSGRPTWCSIFRAIFDFLGRLEFNPPPPSLPPRPPLLCCNFVHYFGFLRKNGVLGGVAHHNVQLQRRVLTARNCSGWLLTARNCQRRRRRLYLPPQIACVGVP